MRFFVHKQHGFAHIGVVVAIVLALLGVGYVAFVEHSAAPAVPSSPSALVESGVNWRTMQWETYQHGEAGLEFSYPPFPLYYMPPMQEYEEKDLRANQTIAGYLHFNMWPIGTEESTPSRREAFSQLARKSQGEECDDLKINTSLFGTDSIARSCRVFISDYGAPMITGFYRSQPGDAGDVIFIAFFRGSKSEGVLSMSLDPNFPSEEIKQMPELFAKPVRAEEVVRRVTQGEFPGITDELTMFTEVLKTVKVSESSASVDATNWKAYRNEAYGFEMKYPSYLTLRANDVAERVPLVKGTRRKHFTFDFTPDSAGILWGSLSVFASDRFAMYRVPEWSFYDQTTASWYAEQAINEDLLTYKKDKKAAMFVLSETDQGVPVYGGGYGDAGYSSVYRIILSPDKNIVIDILYGSGGEIIPPPVKTLLQQFEDDVPFIVKNVRFF